MQAFTPRKCSHELFYSRRSITSEKVVGRAETVKCVQESKEGMQSRCPELLHQHLIGSGSSWLGLPGSQISFSSPARLGDLHVGEDSITPQPNLLHDFVFLLDRFLAPHHVLRADWIIASASVPHGTNKSWQLRGDAF